MTMVRRVTAIRMRPSEAPSRDKKENEIVKTTLNMRRLISFRRNGPLSSSTKTALTSSSSDFEKEEERQESQQQTRTITTHNGNTEALYSPGDEARYLVEQGLDNRCHGRYQEALELFQQALALGLSNTEHRLLWLLLSLVVTQFPKDTALAKTYLGRLKNHVLPEEWIQQEASRSLLNFLQAQNEWSIAFRMSQYAKPDDDASLAKIYFENATNLTTNQAMPQLEKALALCNDDKSKELKQSILYSMVHAHAAEEDWDQALSCQKCYIESLDSSHDKAQAQYDAAQLYIAQHDYDGAHDAVQEGINLSKDDALLEMQLLNVKAHILYLQEKPQDALDICNKLLERTPTGATAAKLYYTMGRICCKSRKYERALQYFQQELKVQKATLGRNHAEVSRIKHEIAHIYDAILGDYDQALKYYQRALEVERHLLQTCPTTSDVVSQISETQRCIGRIFYKRGEFARAMSFADDLSIDSLM